MAQEKISLKIELEDSLANVVRKYLNRVPVLAVDEVEIVKNGSPLYDETIAHRLGLIPLIYKKIGDDEVTLKLKTKDPGIVYSEKLKGDVEVVYKNMPITLLNDGQEIEIVATIKEGRGFEHSKFSPGLMFYRNVVEIIMDKSDFKEIEEIFPEANKKEKGDKVIIIDDQKREIYDVCESIAQKKGKELEVKETKDLILNLESFGQMPIKDMVKKAVDELKKDLKSASKILDKN